MNLYVHNNYKFISQKGFSMLEVLIALVVFSVSLLGLALLQNASMQGLVGSSQLSDAVLLAEDMADRIRANRRHAIESSTYDNVANKANNDCSTGCTAAQIAAKDLFDWDLALTEISSGAAGTITRDGDAFEISINWTERDQDFSNPANDNVNKIYSIRVEP